MSVKTTKNLVLHAQLCSQENACQEILGQYEPAMEVHLAKTPHFAGNLPAGVTVVHVQAGHR